MLPNSQETADLVTFTEEILNRKLHYFCAMNKLQLNILKKTSLSWILEEHRRLYAPR